MLIFKEPTMMRQTDNVFFWALHLKERQNENACRTVYFKKHCPEYSEEAISILKFNNSEYVVKGLANLLKTDRFGGSASSFKIEPQ